MVAGLRVPMSTGGGMVVFLFRVTALRLSCGSVRRWRVWVRILTSSRVLGSGEFWASRVRGWDGLHTSCLPNIRPSGFSARLQSPWLDASTEWEKTVVGGFHAASSRRACSAL